MNRVFLTFFTSFCLLSAVFLIGLSFNVQPVKASGTIYIRADGSIDPLTANITSMDNVTYTFTNNISDSIAVERDNIVVDGAGYTVQGTRAYDSKGITLLERSNVTIKNMTIKAFDYGIYLTNSYNNKMVGNNVTNNHYDGITLYYSLNNAVSGNNITENMPGISLYDSSYNSILGNNIKNNGWHGIILEKSSKNIISGNNLINNSWHGIWLYLSCEENVISGNYITGNWEYGIWFYSSSHNVISGNSITYNEKYGIYLQYSSNDSICHNNFEDNELHTCNEYSTNIWDDGYPSGGNYWSNYTGVDLHSGSNQDETGSDGIGDTAHEIDADNRDRYPLMAPFSMFDAGIWNGTAYNVSFVTNSTVVNFEVDAVQKTISFNVTRVEETAGFCKVTIPNIIIQDLWHGNYAVLLNGTSWPFRNWTDATNTYIYINYTHSTQEVIIIPEFPSAAALSLFMILALVAVVLRKRIQMRERR
jgi:parallel beta-helix repeat protein